jgi:hypothetical protein
MTQIYVTHWVDADTLLGSVIFCFGLNLILQLAALALVREPPSN